MKTVLFVVAGLVIAFVVLAVAVGGAPESPERLSARKRECTTAMMSNMGHSTVGYADKQAYEAEVRSKCAGLQFDGKDIVK